MVENRFFAGAAALLAFTLMTPQLLGAHRPPNFDAAAVAPALPDSTTRLASARESTGSMVPLEWHRTFGVPSFAWLADASNPSSSTASSAQSIGAPASIEDSARRHLAAHAGLYSLSSADAASAYVSGVHDTGRGALVVKFKQRIDGIEVFRDELNVVMTRDRQLVAMSGFLPKGGGASSTFASKRALSSKAFALPASDAISSAFHDLAPEATPIASANLTASNADGGYQSFEMTRHSSDLRASLRSARARQVWFHLPEALEPAWYLEIEVADETTADSDPYGYVISAVDGRVLFRKSLVEDAEGTPYTYRVWAETDGAQRPFNGPQGFGGAPHPTGSNDGFQASFVPQNLVTLSSGPISTKDPWLAPAAGTSNGNNVDAYADLVSPDGFQKGDLRALSTTANTFDYAYDVALSPGTNTTQQLASVTQLFYNINFFHDWYYDSGFNEAAGNAQTNNYGRGGVAGDQIRGEAQDYNGRNNANMSTPADGGRPRMQMYVFDGVAARTLHIDAPSASARDYATGTAVFGPQSFDVPGDIVAVQPADGCTAITTSLTGKIAFIDRGTCTFVVKATNAKAAGAIAVIIGNVASTANPQARTNMACTGSPAPCPAVEQALVPAFNVALNDANVLRAQLKAGTVHGNVKRDVLVDRDGGLDNAIVAHEWGHYLSNRLIGNSSGLTSIQSRGMGEGWSDFLALLMMVRPEDAAVAANANFQGAYAVGGYASSGGNNGPLLNGGYYFAIRRVPYSTDPNHDPLTLRHIGVGQAITGADTAYIDDGSNNAEVHNTGEVWASMLWECYAALLRDTLGDHPRLTFEQAQKRMRDYIVASLRITPADPTFLDARDAVLAAAFASDALDYQAFWQAFAKRGAGVRATPAERYSSANLGALEDFGVGGDLTIGAISLDDSLAGCNKDGLLEGGESGVLTVTIRNRGNVRLKATTGTVSSSDSRITFEGNGALTFPPTDPGQSTSATVRMNLAKTTSILNPAVSIAVRDADLKFVQSVTTSWQPRLNAHDEPKQSATDDVEGTRSSWTVSSGSTGGTSAAWKRLELDPQNHNWYAEEARRPSDWSLVSPPLFVSRTERLTLTFRQKYGFDLFIDSGTKEVFPLDGGVIELSADGGKSWTDIGASASPGYGVTPITADNSNPLEGRKAFIGSSPGASSELPSTSPFVKTTVDLGTAYAGQRVQIRFRLGTALSHSSAPLLGWQIDDIAFTGINNLPFFGLVADRGLCGTSDSTTTLRSSGATAPPGAPLLLEAAVSSSPNAPSGTVEFLEGGNVIAAAVLPSGGRVAIDVSRLAPGPHTIVASFSGSTNFNPSTSAPVTITLDSSGARRRAAGR
ncbi:MAG: M36 family metallopeptidase [Thermoanaerobaculia bacterium]